MKDQLIRYIDLLFAGAQDAGEIKQEILQNTLDRYDDLICQGKAPEAAYRLAISGIGDINEILGGAPTDTPAEKTTAPEKGGVKDAGWKKALRAIAVALYILCPIPLFVLQNEIGLCGLLTFVAIATALMVIAGKNSSEKSAEQKAELTPRQELKRGIRSIIWAVGVAVYFLVSFSTGAWHITWVIFPLAAAVQGLVIACIDLKEEK